MYLEVLAAVAALCKGASAYATLERQDAGVLAPNVVGHAALRKGKEWTSRTKGRRMFEVKKMSSPLILLSLPHLFLRENRRVHPRWAYRQGIVAGWFALRRPGAGGGNAKGLGISSTSSGGSIALVSASHRSASCSDGSKSMERG